MKKAEYKNSSKVVRGKFLLTLLPFWGKQLLQGAIMAKRYNDGMYEGMSDRREQEARDASMIHEDRSAVANLPQDVIMRAYPKDMDYAPEDLIFPDTIAGVDRQKSIDHLQMMKHIKPKKV